MACLAISLQPVNGPDILLQTRSWFPVSRALAAVSAFRLARLHLARGKQQSSSSSASSASLDAIGDDPLAAASGQLVVGVESQYRVVYRLVNSIYVLGVTTAGSDHAAPAVNAFAVADAVNQAVSVVVAACRGVDVTPEKVHRKYPEVYLALDLVLHGVGSVRLSQILATIHGDNLARMVNSSPDAEARARGADPWPAVEHLAQDRHAAREGFSGASFELPQETLAAGDEFSSNIAPATTVATGDEPPPEEAAPVEKDPFAASDLINNKPEEALVGGFKKNKETALVVADPAAALAGLEVTTLPPAEATKPTFIGVEGFEGDYGGIEFGNDEASLAEAFEGLNAPFGGGLDASEFVTTTKKDHKDRAVTGLELLVSSGKPPNAAAGTPLENLLVTKRTEMTAPELFIAEEINAEFKESILVRVGLKGTIFLRTLPLNKAAGKETEFSFRLEGTSGMKRAALQSNVLSNLQNGLFHVRTVSKEEPIPLMKYSFLPKHSPLPLRMRLVKRHSGTLLSVMIQYASNPMLPQPLSNVTFIVKLPVDPTLLNVSPKAVLNRAERELRWHISEIPLKGPAGRLRARMPVDQDSKDGELEVVGMVKFAYQGPFTLSGIKLRPATDGIAQFNEVGHTFSSGSYLCI
ncbi:hypothetical protein BDA96_07G093000 [Sorghum bicolor]|jgi:hypothetical protein|uniref:MHD domain-containing protein n=2 Tax=Sorghum bicolor TaxID=4558 RepID=A0A921U8Y2_SORBI|nr:uncharacterized protein LOC8057881 [Sorghum bicolor]EES14778.1 hypothetical protein SORBI_3007G088900 [Sorghum bicolor]KAG0523077.1 hypothetical protein BDA96_07G093000 [Sorghum bicolor]|eukprot:XP_002445283.1 uncharacterized protein LOC8057881 [Sorghum bicolor]